jgi:hypothetical protein
MLDVRQALSLAAMRDELSERKTEVILVEDEFNNCSAVAGSPTVNAWV